jgi:hypothetical protein
MKVFSLQYFAEAGRVALSGLGRVQAYGGANQIFQSLLVHLVAFAEVDGAPHSTLETGIEQT